MSPDIRRIPASEMVERVQKELVRDNSAAEDKYWGRINDTYLYDIPGQIDWRHIRTISSVSTVADYSTGDITDISGTTVTGDSTSWTSDNSNNMLLKVSGNNEVYRVTYVSATSLTLDRTWIETDISSTDTSYSLYQDRYALASTFDRMALDMDHVVYYWSGGTRIYLDYLDIEEFEQIQTPGVGTPSQYTLKWVSGDPYIFIDVPDTTTRTIYYTYVPTLSRLDEYTTGTITTLANGGTAVTGSGTDFDGYITDTSAFDYYFRIDGDGTAAKSKWYKIASAGSDTAVTLSDAYLGTAISSGSASYTISKLSLLPAGCDIAIIYGAAVISVLDQGASSQMDRWAAVYERGIGLYKAIESKRNYGKQRLKTIYEKHGARR